MSELKECPDCRGDIAISPNAEGELVVECVDCLAVIGELVSIKTGKPVADSASRTGKTASPITADERERVTMVRQVAEAIAEKMPLLDEWTHLELANAALAELEKHYELRRKV